MPSLSALRRPDCNAVARPFAEVFAEHPAVVFVEGKGEENLLRYILPSAVQRNYKGYKRRKVCRFRPEVISFSPKSKYSLSLT